MDYAHGYFFVHFLTFWHSLLIYTFLIYPVPKGVCFYL
jgi:hypothetical protein